MNKHGIQMSSIPEWTRKYLEGEKDVSLGYWLAVPVTDREAEHDKVFGYEELPGDASIFDGDNSFDLLAGILEWLDKPLQEPFTLENPIQDHSPLIDRTQERVRKQMQDTMLMEWQFGAPHPKRYCMPKELKYLSLSLHGLTSNSAMRHIHLQPDASLAWNSRQHPLGCLISIGANLRMA